MRTLNGKLLTLPEHTSRQLPVTFLDAQHCVLSTPPTNRTISNAVESTRTRVYVLKCLMSQCWRILQKTPGSGFRGWCIPKFNKFFPGLVSIPVCEVQRRLLFNCDLYVEKRQPHKQADKQADKRNWPTCYSRNFSFHGISTNNDKNR